MQPIDKKRSQRMSREQQKKQKEVMEQPVNKFLNAEDKDGNIKYPIAEQLRKYFVQNPDPIIDDMRMTNAILHDIRWNKKQSQKYLKESQSDGAITMKDKEGKIMERDDCYLAHIASEQNTYLSVSRLRKHLIERLLQKCDGVFFTFDQYNEFVGKVRKILGELGFEIFPDKVKLIEPL